MLKFLTGAWPFLVAGFGVVAYFTRLGINAARRPPGPVGSTPAAPPLESASAEPETAGVANGAFPQVESES